jgi:hypothetical protein
MPESMLGMLFEMWRKILHRLNAEESPQQAESLAKDFRRASGLCVCPACGLLYYDHPADPVYEFLTVLCDLSRVKL